jgi:hypothetical protein
MFNRERQSLFVPFSDLGWGLAGVFIAIAIILFQVIGTPKTDEETRGQGTLIFETYWNDDYNTDVDTWVKTPLDTAGVGYSRKQGSIAALLVDDTGTHSSIDKSGRNREFISTQGLEVGTYSVSAHLFRTGTAVLPMDVKLVVTMSKEGKSAIQLFVVNIKLLKQCQEKVFINFDLDEEGNLIPDSVHHTHKPIRSSNSCNTTDGRGR